MINSGAFGVDGRKSLDFGGGGVDIRILCL